MRSSTFHVSARALAFAALFGATFASSAAPVTAGGVVFQDHASVGAEKLVLNGAGVRWRTIFQVYSAGLYLSRKAETLDEVIAAPGARQIRLVLLRDLDADQISQLFMRGVMRNLPQAESIRLTSTMLRLSEALSGLKRLAPGDVLTIDFDPGRGTSFHAKGQQRGETIPGPAVFDAAMHIWLGQDPADWKLKDALLGKPAHGSSPIASN